MSNQLFEDGKVIEVNGVELECTGVTYQENEAGERHTFGYTFRVKAELDAEREAAREAEEAAANAEALAAENKTEQSEEA